MQWMPTISLRADDMLDPDSKNAIALSCAEAEELIEMLQEALEDES